MWKAAAGTNVNVNPVNAANDGDDDDWETDADFEVRDYCVHFLCLKFMTRFSMLPFLVYLLGVQVTKYLSILVERRFREAAAMGIEDGCRIWPPGCHRVRPLQNVEGIPCCTFHV